MMTVSTEDDLPPLDIRHGIKPLSKYIRKTERQTYHLVTTGKVPAKRVGSRWVWSPDKVRATMMEGLE